MESCKMIVRVIFCLMVLGILCNLLIQQVNQMGYRYAKKMTNVAYQPEYLQFNKELAGYGYHLEEESSEIVIFFGGANDIAYNSVAKYAGAYGCPFICADLYGTGTSGGRLNLDGVKQTAIDVYEWVTQQYEGRRVIAMGHGFGTGVATYLASRRDCESLVLLAGYRDLSDLYNKIFPIYWGPLKVCISNNVLQNQYAESVECETFIIGSKKDKTLNVKIQENLKEFFPHASLKVFDHVKHSDYLLDPKVIAYIQSLL